MKLIPKFLMPWLAIELANSTNVQKPLVFKPIKKILRPGQIFLNIGENKILTQPKEAVISLDTRTDKLRKLDLKYALLKRKLIELEKAQKRTGEVASAFLERTMPSYWALLLTNESLNPILLFLIDGFSPGKVIKGGLSLAALSPVIKATSVKKIFEPNRWFKFRNPQYVTLQDIKTLESFLPEYKNILEKALDEGNYMIVSKGFPGSKLLEDGRYIYLGDEGSWIQSLSKNFKAKFGDKTLKIGYKGGADLKIEGVVNTHTTETFPILDNGVFFAGPLDYANLYNNGKPAPAFWLGFRKPYDMLNGGKKPFLLEDNNIRFVRSVEASPSFKGEFPDLTINTIHKVWNSDFINDPEIMKLLTSNPYTLNPLLAKMRLELLHKIRSGLHRNIRDNFTENIVKKNILNGKYRPLAGNYYDGYIGRDHAFGYGEYNGVVKDDMWTFGSFPETYVIKQPEQAASVIGNNGAFKGPAYTRKLGGKLYDTRFKRFRRGL